MWPRVCLLGLVLGLAAIASAQADPKPEPQSQPEYPVCNIPLAVGEVPNSPFLAELVDDSWTNAPDGRKIPVDSPDPQPGVVARDSKGRVMVKLPSKIAYTKSESDSNSETKAESRGWSETICDPVAGTVTRMSYSDVFHRGEDPSTGESVLFPAGVAGNALVRPQVNFHTTVVFKYWHYVVKGREDLGPETFEGTPAYRFRSHPVQNGTSGHDTVNSDEIFVELAETRWGDEPGRENERKITHIRRGEPSATLFCLRHTSRSDRARSARTKSKAHNSSPSRLTVVRKGGQIGGKRRLKTMSQDERKKSPQWEPRLDGGNIANQEISGS